MSEADDRLHLRVKLQGEDIGLEVAALLVEDGDRLIDKATIVVPDSHRAFTDFVGPRWSVQVELGWTSLHAVLFEGEVTRVRGHAGQRGERFVSITALDPAHRMHREPRSRNHVGALTAIVQTVVAPYGLALHPIELDENPTFTEREPQRQTFETDWAFLQRLASEYGARAFVEYNEGASRFYFVPASRIVQAEPAGVLEYREGHGSLLAFSYKQNAFELAPTRRVTTVDRISGEVLAAETAPFAPDAPVAPDAAHQARLGRSDAGLAGAYGAAAELGAAALSGPAVPRVASVLAGAPSDPTLRERVLRVDPTRARGWSGTGIAPGMPLLRAKSMLALRGIGAWAEGNWYVSQARHIVRDGTYRTQFVATR